jgi:hypothetical protein
MRVVVISREHTDYARSVESFMTDFKRQTGRELELLDPDSRDGAQFCRTYDIVEYPTIIAISDDGQVQNTWRGAQMPTISEVSYYA